ncbi:hypothetical protein RND71_014111 [Anisodus tanguticus]|uniref:Uncharacterized protein n=1 Tax=Anisodus tanguticus TaxID=243964 RepID=A0AAE1SC16_9SOLA|nr:hypothetical protein RND71_014111 [Anisodus tanguticus]
MDSHNNNEQQREELNKGYAEYVKWLGMQDNLLRQKTKTNWFNEGDYNSKYFHSILRDRKKLHIHTIKNHRGEWVQGDDKIAKSFFNLL